jgi:hypothetical protein
MVSVLAVLCALPSVQGQGYFEFKNFPPPATLDAPIYDAEGNRLRGTDYAAALYVGPTPDELEITLDAVTMSRTVILPFRNTDLTAGYIAAFGNDPLVVAQNVVGGTLVWAQVRAWYVPLGDTYEEVQERGLGGYGESPPLQLVAGHFTGAGSTQLIGLESFSLRPTIPEPGTLSLLLVALPVLWLTAGRRGKNQIGKDS